MNNPQDDQAQDGLMKSLICDVQTPFAMTLQERLHLFALLDSAVTSVRSGFPDLFGIRPEAFPVLEGLHFRFVQSFHGGGSQDPSRPASSTLQ